MADQKPAPKFGPTRAQLQALAKRRIREARVLFDNDEFDGAYYLGGYAIECALKAIVIKEHRFPPNDANRLYTHDLENLKKYAGLELELAQAPGGVQGSWMLIAPWSEETRYDEGKRDKVAAEPFLKAIDDANDGILTWLKTKW